MDIQISDIPGNLRSFPTRREQSPDEVIQYVNSPTSKVLRVYYAEKRKLTDKCLRYSRRTIYNLHEVVVLQTPVSPISITPGVRTRPYFGHSENLRFPAVEDQFVYYD